MMKEAVYSYNTQDEGRTQELINSLLHNQYVQRVMKENGLTEEIIRNYPWKMKRWLDSFAPCINCHGLRECRQAIAGFYDNPVYDGVMQIEKKACRYRREKLKEEEHLSNYLISDLPQDYRPLTFASLNLKGETQDYCIAARACMEAVRNDTGMYLYGPMGTGKTYLAACAANYYAMHGKKVCFIHYPSFTRRMASLVKTGEYQKEVERLCYCHMLVIDDIGAESVSEWNRDSILLPVLNRRYDDHLPTWFTGNEDMDTLREHFMISRSGNNEQMKAERIIERISNMCEMKTLFGEDRRKTRI